MTPDAAVLLWIRDDNTDQQVQGAECAMLEHDATAKIIRLYPAGQGDAVQPLPWNIFSSQAVIANFKAGRAWRPFAREIPGVRFGAVSKDSSTLNPTLEFTLKFRPQDDTDADDSRSLTMYGTCSVRARQRNRHDTL